MRRNGALVTRKLLTTLASIMIAMAMMLGVSLVATHTAQAAEYNIGDLGWVNQNATKVQISNDGGSTWQDYAPGMTVDYDAKVRVQLHWDVPNSVEVKDGTTFVYELPDGIAFESGKTYTLYGSDGTSRGTYTINGNRVTAVYNRADTGGSSGTDISAYVTIDGSITVESAGGGDGGNKSFEFPGYGNLDVDITPAHLLTAVKNGAISVPEDSSKYDFVIDITSTGTNHNVIIDDEMQDLLTLMQGSIEIYTDADCTKAYTGSWQVQNQNDKGFVINIDQMNDGESLWVRYRVQIDRAAVNADCKTNGCRLSNNKATYYSEDNTTKKTTEKGIWINSSWGVSKWGNVDKDGNITWKITVIPDETDKIDGTTIKDTLGKDLKEPTDEATVTVICYDNKNYDPNPVTKTLTWKELKNGTAKLPLKDDGTAYAKYELSYATTPENAPEEGSGEKKEYTNHVDVNTPSGDGVGTDGTATVGKDAVSLSKKVDQVSDDGTTITWVTNFTALTDLKAGQTLTDTIDKDTSGKIVGDWQLHGTDPEDIKIYTDAARTKEYDGSVTKKIADDRKSFTITFNDVLKRNTKLYIVYQSTVRDTAPAAGTRWNTVDFMNKSASASQTPVVDNLTKSNRWYYDPDTGTGSNTENRLRWELRVHDISSSARSVTITDTLPDNQSYVFDSLKVEDNNRNRYDGVSVVSSGPNADGRYVLNFTITKDSKAFQRARTSDGLLLVYDTTFTDRNKAYEDSQKNWGNGVAYTNSAQIAIDGEVQVPDTSTITAKPGTLLDKTGKYNAETAPFINYTVKVNPDGSRLNGGNALTLTDTLGAALDLRMDSVLIMDSATKTEVKGAAFAYDPATRKLTFTIPDAQAITITYKAMVNLAPGSDFGKLGDNTIVLSGYENNGGSSGTHQSGKVIESQGGWTDSDHALQIYKYADGNTSAPLNGAIFTVEKLNVDIDPNNAGKNLTSMGTPEVITNKLQSGTSGYTQTVGLRADSIYRVTETQAPEGYEQSNLPAIYLVFPGKNGPGADYYEGVTVDGNSLKVAVAADDDGVTTLQTYLWMLSNASSKKASLEVSKLDDYNLAVPGAELTLTKNGDSSFNAQTCTTSTTADNNAKCTFTNLTYGVYTLSETKTPEGYQTATPITVTVTAAGKVIVGGKDVTDGSDTGTITMTDHVNVTSISARKIWNDGDNQDGRRGTVIFHLNKTVNGVTGIVPGQDRTIYPSTPASGLTVSWTNLPTKENGKSVTYSVTEEYKAVDGFDYETSGPAVIDGVYTFTNTYTPKTMRIPVTKTWNDSENQDGSRPESVTVHLYANGVDTKKTITISEGSGWKGEFTDLPVYESGQKITYTLKEDVPDGYTAAVTGSADKGFEITNMHKPDNTEVWVSKQDVGGNEIDGARMKLTGKLADGSAFKTEEWTSSSANGPKKFKLDPGTYTLAETKAPTGYKTADPVTFTVERDADGKLHVLIGGEQLADNIVTMVDQFNPVRVKVSKRSLTGGVGEIKGAQLTINGTTLAGERIKEIAWTSTGFEYNITLMPGTYTLHEKEAPAGYQQAPDITFTVTLDGKVEVNNKEQDGNTVTMIDEPSETNVIFSKVEVGGGVELTGATFKLEGVTFEKDATPFDGDVFKNMAGVTVEDNGATLVWTSSADGPKSFPLQDGTYTLTETAAPEGFEPADPITFTVSKGQVVVNEQIRPGNVIRVENARAQYTRISVLKRWEDNNNSDDLRKDITVYAQLMANGTAMSDENDPGKYKVELNARNNWACDWTGLPVKDSSGKRIVYKVSEILESKNNSKDQYHNVITKVEGVDGTEFRMYNIHQPEAVNLDLVKNWDDKDNQDGKRPDTIQITVTGTSKYSDNNDHSEVMIVTTLKPNDKGEWKWTLENLPKNNIYGNSYTYTVQETPVDGYETPVIKDITAKEDGKAVGNQTFEITNTRNPETVTVTVNKVWNDDHDYEGKRPKSVTLWLLSSYWDKSNGWPTPQSADGSCKDTDDRKVVGVSCVVLDANGPVMASSGSESGSEDGSESGSAQTDDAASSSSAQTDDAASGGSSVSAASDTWSYTFTNLPKYHDGTFVKYTLTEQAVENYTPRDTDAATTQVTMPSVEQVAAQASVQSATQTAAQASVQSADGSIAALADDDTRVLSLTNDYTPDETTLTVNKAWQDDNDKAGVRPTSIWVQLYRKPLTGVLDAERVGDPVELQSATVWTHTFTGLSVNANYEVKEVMKDNDGNWVDAAFDGYNKPVVTPITTDGKTTGYTITNSIAPVLPESGGSGTTAIILTGLVMITLSGAFFARRFAKKGGAR